MEQTVTLKIMGVPEHVGADDLLTRAEAVMGNFGPAVVEDEWRALDTQFHPTLDLIVSVPTTSPLAALRDDVIGGFARVMIGLGIENCQHVLVAETQPETE